MYQRARAACPCECVRAPAGRATVSRGNSAACAARHGRARRVERCDVPGVLLVQDVILLSHARVCEREQRQARARHRGTPVQRREYSCVS
jgi:hypothetical protein